MVKFAIISEEDLEALVHRAVTNAVSQLSLKQEGKSHLYLNIQEASSLLNLSVQTIYSHTSKREIPFTKRGKKLYFRKDELEKWLEEGFKPSLNHLRIK